MYGLWSNHDGISSLLSKRGPGPEPSDLSSGLSLSLAALGWLTEGVRLNRAIRHFVDNLRKLQMFKSLPEKTWAFVKISENDPEAPLNMAANGERWLAHQYSPTADSRQSMQHVREDTDQHLNYSEMKDLRLDQG